jgi:putative exporter of polyketide antibiotics
MKKFLTSTLAILVACLMFMTNDTLANVGNPALKESIKNQVQVKETPAAFVQSGIFPFLRENSGFPLEISKSNILIICIILTITLLVFAHKNSFETDIYAFYHTNKDGSIIFESIEDQKSFVFRGNMAKVFRISGILTAITSIVMIIL